MTRLLAAAAAAAALSGPAFCQTFIGQNFTASRSDVDGFRYDACGAAGADYFVELSGGRYGVYRKSDGVRVQTSDLETFWNNAGVAPANNRAYDPRVLYDPYAKRWYALSADNLLTTGTLSGTANPNSFLLAISNSSDPTAGWTGFAIDSDSNDDHWADFPMIGFNKDVVALAAAMYNVGTRTAGQSNTFVVLPKSDLLSAAPTVAHAKHFEELPNSATGFPVQPAVDMKNGSLPLPLLAVQVNGAALTRDSVAGTPQSPSIQTSNFVPLSPASVTAPSADQPGPKANIFSWDLRSTASVVRTNGELWAVNCVNQNGRAALRWYRVNEGNNTLIASGYIADASLNFMYPSIAVNDSGDVVVGMSGTDSNTYVSAFAVVGKTAGGTTTFGTPFITQPGASDYEVLVSGNNKWGDYSSTTVDPTDPSVFWTIQPYVHQTDGRATRVCEIIVPQPGETRWKGQGDGNYATGANWFGAAPPTAASHVIFSRATDPAGSADSVAFAADATVDRISVRQGSLVLALDFSTLSATNASSLTPSITVGEFGGTPTLGVTHGTLAGVHANIAASPISSGTINLDQATLALQGSLNVGGTDTTAGGTAVLNIGYSSTLQVAQTVHVWNGGVVNFDDGTMSTGPLVITGGRVNVASGGGPKALRATDAQTSSGGRIDLGSNALVVDYAPAGPSPLPSIKSQIAGAHAGGTWAGPGIATSSGDGSHFGLGYAEASALGGGVPAIFGSVDDTAVVARWTLYGDADLSGNVDLTDFTFLAAHFNAGDETWLHGDFNYDGNVDLTDFTFLASNFNQVAASAPGPIAPEPMALLMYSPVVVYMSRRQRAPEAGSSQTAARTRLRIASTRMSAECLPIQDWPATTVRPAVGPRSTEAARPSSKAGSSTKRVSTDRTVG